MIGMKKTLLSIAFCALSIAGQPASKKLAPNSGTDAKADLTISYSISITSKRGNTGIAETYNGGIETLFAGHHEARLRLVSLMRIHSVFIVTDKGQLKNVTLIKESGSNKHRLLLTPAQWRLYNKKYDGSACRLTTDTTLVLKHLCKKAIVSLKDGRQMTAWYTPAIQRPICSYLEPAFSAIPGLVLKYEYTYKKKTITYTATSISEHPISPDILTVPAD
jgi:hypothetical protein